MSHERHCRGNDLPSVRGHKAILVSCDNAKEREAVKECMNLINQTIESIYKDQEISTQLNGNTRELSVAEILQNEINELKHSSKSTAGQSITSIKTGIKGVLLFRLNKKYLDPVKIIQELYQRVIRDKLPICRYMIRIIPLSKIFFPNIELLESNVKELLTEEFPGAFTTPDAVPTSETVPPATADVGDDTSSGEKRRLDDDVVVRKEARIYPPFIYSVLFRKRNCDAISRTECIEVVGKQMPSFGLVNYRQPVNVIVVEALRNVCGITLLRDYENYNDFNIRQFQFKITGIQADSGSNKAVTAEEKTL